MFFHQVNLFFNFPETLFFYVFSFLSPQVFTCPGWFLIIAFEDICNQIIILDGFVFPGNQQRFCVTSLLPNRSNSSRTVRNTWGMG